MAASIKQYQLHMKEQSDVDSYRFVFSTETDLFSTSVLKISVYCFAKYLNISRISRLQTK